MIGQLRLSGATRRLLLFMSARTTVGQHLLHRHWVTPGVARGGGGSPVTSMQTHTFLISLRIRDVFTNCRRKGGRKGTICVLPVRGGRLVGEELGELLLHGAGVLQGGHVGSGGENPADLYEWDHIAVETECEICRETLFAERKLWHAGSPLFPLGSRLSPQDSCRHLT